MRDMTKLVPLLQDLGISVVDEYGNIKLFNDVLGEMRKGWDEFAKENSCTHKFHETKRVSHPTTDGDTLIWVWYKCSLCGCETIERED